MKILYGVAGDGMGHAIRSRVVIEQLLRRHEVYVVTSRRAHAYLASHLPNVRRIWGLEHSYGGGQVRRGRTLLKALGGLLSGGVRNAGRMLRLMAAERFDLIVSDFEAFSHLAGRLSDTPVVTIDNIQALSRLAVEGELGEKARLELGLARAFVRLTTPGARHHFVTSFFGAECGDARTTIVPPILRPEILSARPRPGDHLLVYQTAAGDGDLLSVLQAANVECRCYGFVRNIDRPLRTGAITHLPFGEARFIDDLCSAWGVVTGGGFTLISEALHLGKPILSIPLRHQAEQALNAHHLERLGFGMAAERLTPPVLASFTARRDSFARTMRSAPRWDNSMLFNRLEGLIAGLEKKRCGQTQRRSRSAPSPRSALRDRFAGAWGA